MIIMAICAIYVVVVHEFHNLEFQAVVRLLEQAHCLLSLAAARGLVHRLVVECLQLGVFLNQS